MTGKRFDFTSFFGAIIIGLFGAGVIGWIMNLQNIFQYPISSNECLVSIAGIFIPFIGAVTGWLW